MFAKSTSFIARSVYFGPDNNNNICIIPVDKQNELVANGLVLRRTNVVAVLVYNGGTEWAMMDSLEFAPDLTEKNSLFKWLLGINSNNTDTLKSTDNSILSEFEVIIDSLCDKYNLNDDQRYVVKDVALKVCRMYSSDQNIELCINPISLVHGPFGSGKSLVLGVLIIVLHNLKSNFIDRYDNFKYLRVLVCSMTNAAVDRVLLSLLKLGFNEIIRVGNSKRVSKQIKPFLNKSSLSSLGYDDLESNEFDQSNSFENGISDDDVEDFCISDKTLETAFVVGSTCLSATNPALSSLSFPLVLVDEVGQVPEYMTLIPLVRSEAKFVILAGDPQQLPPTVTRKSDKMAIESGPTLLSKQYRCHPNISKLLNSLFYNNRLVDGIGIADRLPVFKGLPAMCFVDVYEGSEKQNGGSVSFYNSHEIDICIALINFFVYKLKIEPLKIGVISLYKDQANMIADRLGQKDGTSLVKSSTVDAFQGSEKDIIILSCIRTQSIGFSSNYPRINVALSRAKKHCIVLGNKSLLATSKLWANTVEYCKGKLEG
ncbi:Protein ZGRF1 [Smittium culicis]|uniref:Protein ZGRF1 n=1 Tax=Smittium culicis TaxID=133412 RepID=A0A1R1XQ79_9FUNG|nr:Protein ZGRF1 [Smittium culicis]